MKHKIFCLNCEVYFWAITPITGFHIVSCPACGQKYAVRPYQEGA